MNKLVLISLLASSYPLYAATGSFTEESYPAHVISIAPAYGNAYFHASSSDFPSGVLSKFKKLTSIQYNWYPYIDGINGPVELCYRKPYMSAQTCIDITNSQSGTIYAFNNYAFGAGATVLIRHFISGPSSVKHHNSIKDKVTFNYSYNP